MSKKIQIINLNCGNINSVENMFNFFECDVFINENFDSLEDADAVVIPGNGNFEYFSNEIKKRSQNKLLNLINSKKIPILGICIGLQIFFEKGYENNVLTNGLGIIKGNVEILQNKLSEKNFSLPHIGWNEIKIKKQIPLLSNIDNKSSFYFLHSYACKNHNLNECISSTNYGENFISIAEKDKFIGVQFHPEKSHSNGLKIISNWLEYYVKN